MLLVLESKTGTATPSHSLPTVFLSSESSLSEPETNQPLGRRSHSWLE